MRNIVIFGFMGTGKTTVGRLLAEALGLRFVDMDDVIEERAGCPISTIFADQGEPAFRDIESAVAADLGREKGLVIAAGGGAMLRRENVKNLEQNALVCCLTATPETILERVARESHRPLLEEGDKARRIITLLESRRSLYEALPNVVDTTGLTPDEVSTRIQMLYRA